MTAFLVVAFLWLSPLKVWAATECWYDANDPSKTYPNVNGTAQPLPGLPTKADIGSFDCKADDSTCTSGGGIAAPAYGCPTGICCLTPAKSLGQCYNNYVGADRGNIKSTTCVKTLDQCKSPNKDLGAGTTGFGCPTDQYCCATMGSGSSGGGASGAAIPQTGSTAAWQYQNPEKTGIVLVSCTQSGNCTIDDLVQQGINFAKWLMGIAGALFLLVFIYGGAMYLASFGNSAWVTKGKTALTRGAIGIVLVMGAWTIVSYVATSLGYTPVGTGASGTGSSTTQADVCGTASDPGSAGYSCINLDSTHVEGAGTGKYTCIVKKCESQPNNNKYKCCKAN